MISVSIGLNEKILVRDMKGKCNGDNDRIDFILLFSSY